jgi:hypothetical protein
MATSQHQSTLFAQQQEILRQQQRMWKQQHEERERVLREQEEEARREEEEAAAEVAALIQQQHQQFEAEQKALLEQQAALMAQQQEQEAAFLERQRQRATPKKLSTVQIIKALSAAKSTPLAPMVELVDPPPRTHTIGTGTETPQPASPRPDTRDTMPSAPSGRRGSSLHALSQSLNRTAQLDSRDYGVQMNGAPVECGVQVVGMRDDGSQVYAYDIAHDTRAAPLSQTAWIQPSDERDFEAPLPAPDRSLHLRKNMRVEGTQTRDMADSLPSKNSRPLHPSPPKMVYDALLLSKLPRRKPSRLAHTDDQ